jgi:hypothetical protein
MRSQGVEWIGDKIKHRFRVDCLTPLRAELAERDAETERLKGESAFWQEEARRYCENADFWREQLAAERADKAELHATYQVENMRLREELDRARLPEELVERIKYATLCISEAHPTEYSKLHLVEGSFELFRDILAAVGEQP